MICSAQLINTAFQDTKLYLRIIIVGMASDYQLLVLFVYDQIQYI